MNAKMATEEAELWEQIQFILVDGVGRDLEGQELVDFVNDEFEKNNLKAIMGIREDGYEVTYGIYSRKLALLKNDISVQTVYAAVEGQDSDWEYIVLENGTLKLTGYKHDKVGNIQIPNVIKGVLVTEIGNIFSSSSIESVSIPEGIEIIDNEAFSTCLMLSCEIKFPSSLKQIGDFAFYDCKEMRGNLNEIVKQNIRMGKNVFGRCSKLTGDIQVLIDTLDLGTNIIEEGQFSGFSGVTGRLIIPARISEIRDNAFYGCSKIESIEFENDSQLKSIGSAAFSQCKSANNLLEIPEKVKTIAANAFEHCEKLSGLTLNNNLKSIGRRAFSECYELSGTLNIPNTINQIEEYTFYETNLENVNFLYDNTVNSLYVGSSAFSSCKNLKNLKFMCSTDIGMAAFWSCDSLLSVNGDNFINSIRNKWFCIMR